jgi:DNA segregation ATPase FtsK/SpoIIIE, S-DNA-T family
MSKLFEKQRAANIAGDLLGLLWFSLSVLLALSLGSYSALDPSLNSLSSGGHPQNLCGYIGSFVADIFYQCFGLTSWLIVLAGLRLCLASFSRKKHENRRWWVDGFMLLIVACLLSAHFNDVRFFSGSIRLGGWIGYILVRQLTPVFNPVGLDVLLVSGLLASIILWSNNGISGLFEWPRQLFKGWAEDFSEALEHFGKIFERKPPEPKITRAEPTLPKNFFPVEKETKPNIDSAVSGHNLPADLGTTDTWIPDPDDLTPISGFFSEQKTKEKKAPLKTVRKVANWTMPKLSLLDDPPTSRTKLDEREIKSKAKLLVEKLAQFSVRGEVMGIKPGPAVTMFEFKPAADVKISKITDLADDLSLALSSESVRIIAPIPGRDVVGIETSNAHRENVYLKDILQDETFWSEECKLPITLGRKADGEPRVVDLRKIPHLLVAGTTGSGKSVFVVSMLTSLLFKHSPKTLKLILVDPKQVDLAAFSNLPHLIMPPIREPKKAVSALRWAIREMEKRYRSMSKFGARGLEQFNDIANDLSGKQVDEHQKSQEALEGAFHPESYYYQPLPYIAIVVEEFGDLMAVDKVNVEQAVVRLAQMARACGIHLVLAMQSPRKDVVTGLIKTNIPGRISFKVASKMDSRIILDEGGGERLLARGDMLFVAPGVTKPERHHGAYLSEEEIGRVVHAWTSQGEPEYDETAMKSIEGSGGGFDLEGAPLGDSMEDGFSGDDDIRDDRYDEILAYVASQKEVSASLLQRRFRLGYPRAARMIEIFETEGVVGPANGSKPRQVIARDLSKMT